MKHTARKTLRKSSDKAKPATQKAGRQLTPAQKERIVKKFDPEIRQLERLLSVYLNNDKNVKKTLTPQMKKGLKRYLRTQKKSTLICSIKILRQVIHNANKYVVLESREPSSNATKDELIDEYFATLVAGWNAQGSKKHVGGMFNNPDMNVVLDSALNSALNSAAAGKVLEYDLRHIILGAVVVVPVVSGSIITTISLFAALVEGVLMIALIWLLVLFVYRTVMIIPELIKGGSLSNFHFPKVKDIFNRMGTVHRKFWPPERGVTRYVLVDGSGGTQLLAAQGFGVQPNQHAERELGDGPRAAQRLWAAGTADTRSARATEQPTPK